MCLDFFYPKSKLLGRNTEGVGYKVMLAVPGGYDTPMKGGCNNRYRVIPKGKWVDERLFRPSYEHDRECLACPVFERRAGLRFVPDKDYPFGWHIFLSLENAQRWIGAVPFRRVVKVAFRDVRGVGEQDILSPRCHRYAKVVIAGEMKILEEVQ